jgi:D-alanyl-lipoteichoic acid acyltransferase DltB (MBOAT superfamily)
MLFNSINYLIFFPLVVMLYFAIPYRGRYLWLLVASYYFYMAWNPKYAMLIAFSTVITYLSGLLMGRENQLLENLAAGTPETLRLSVNHYKKVLFRKKLWVFLSMAINLTILFLFKYFDFFMDNLNRVLGKFGMEFIDPGFDVILPVGISFYTFQALSYTMDVYRGDIYVERNFFKYALFVSFFPQLVAGPIERSKNLLVQISRRHYFDYQRVKNGLLLMLWGFFLKLVIADRVAIIVNTVYNDYEKYQGLVLVLATLAFGVQIYCDFASYSLIAKGSAQVMGFKLMDNFNQPYFARSIGEFWHRWHISLSTWFRDYLYIPLGGNRKGTFRKYINIMIVFLVSGLWHGANWTFVIWGFLHGAFQVVGQITRPIKEKYRDFFGIDPNRGSYKLGQILITYGLANFAWIFFRAPNVTAAFGIIKNMVSTWNPWIFTDGTLYTLGLTVGSLWAGLVALCILIGVSIAQYNGIGIRQRFERQGLVFRWVISLGLIFSIIIFGIYGPGYSASQFIYFQF